MAKRIEVKHTPDGFVVRRFYHGHSEEFRWQPDAQIVVRRSRELDWVPINRALVLTDVLRAFAECAREQEAKDGDFGTGSPGVREGGWGGGDGPDGY